jgi:hypothetical protein
MLKNIHSSQRVADLLIDHTGFNLKQIPGRSYEIFDPQFREEKRQLSILLEIDVNVIYPHLLMVRQEAYDVIDEEYVFIRPYRVGHTLEGKLIVVVVDVQVRGGCHIIDDEGKIDGSGRGDWYAVLCSGDALAQLEADLEAEEARRKALIPKVYYRQNEDTGTDTSELKV